MVLPDPHLALLAAVAVAAAGFLRGMTGFGFALAAVPMLSLVLPPQRAVVLVVLLQFMIGFRDIVMLRSVYDKWVLIRLISGAIFGVLPGIYLLSILDPAAMRVAAGAIVLFALVPLIRPPKVSLPRTSGWPIGTGLVSGFLSGLAAMPAPPTVLYLMLSGTEAVRMRATLIIFFFATSAMSIPGLVLKDLVGRSDVIFAVLMLPVMVISTWAGTHAFTRLNDRGYRNAALLTLAAMAVIALGRGLGSML